MAEEIDWLMEHSAQERADFILDTVEDSEVRDEISRRYGWPTGLSKDEILDRLLALYDYAPVDGESQHG
jgi:hypothetical protein